MNAEKDCPRVRELLNGYILGQLDPEEREFVEAHLAECPDCRSWAEFARSLADVVRAREIEGRGYHLSTHLVTRLAFGSEFLSPSDAREAKEHLSRCNRCRDLVELATKATYELGISRPEAERTSWLQRFLDALQRPFTKRLAPAWIGAAVVLVVLGFLYFRQRGAIVPTEQRVAETQAETPSEIGRPEPHPAQPAAGTSGRPLVAEAEAAAADGNRDLALALADSAWAVGSSQYDETNSDHFFVSYRDSVGKRVYLSSYEEGDSLVVGVLRVREKVLGPDHPDIALDLDDLAMLREREWRHEETVHLRERALAIRENALDPLDPGLALSTMSLAHHYSHLGRYSEAEPLYSQALYLRKQIYGPHISDSQKATKYIAQAHDNLAHLYMRQGRYAEAEELYRAALKVREIGYSPDHASIGANLTYLGSVSWALGRYDEAEDFYRRGLDIREKALGPDHPDVAASMSALAGVLVIQGEGDATKYDEAEALYVRILEMRRTALEREGSPPDHPGIAMGLDNLASLNTARGRYAEAKPLYEEALEVWYRCFGFEHPRSVGTISDFANNYKKMREYEAADAQYARALAISEGAYGPGNPRIATVLESTCLPYRLEERSDEALPLARRAVDIRQKIFRENAIFLSETNALAFSHSLARSVANYLSCYIDAGAPDDQVGVAADIIFANKGPVSDEIFERQRIVFDESDPEASAIAMTLDDVKTRLAQAYFAGPGNDIEVYVTEVASLQNLASDLETQLARVSSGFRETRERCEATAGALASLMPERSALVEYLRFNYIDPYTEELVPRYAALVLREGGDPMFFDLGEAAEIDGYIDDYSKHMAGFAPPGRPPSAADDARYAGISDNIYASVWQPIEDELVGADMVLIAPDGALNLLSFGGLKTGQGSYLVETARLHYLTSGRDLMRLGEQIESSRGLLALGDPDYGTPEAEEDIPGQTEDVLLLAAGDTERGVLPDCDEFWTRQLRRLPGTEREIETVKASWLEEAREPVSTYFGADATEERVKAGAPGSRVIHLATHGYFLGSECGSVGQPEFGMEGRYFPGVNPLLLSGLFLAGANTTIRDRGGTDEEDGVLTAYEVSALSLRGTDLVVLSACETARGEVQEGEGTYGLRRAFQMAGARTVISTLWRVSDRITSEIMGELYSDPGRPAAEALRAVQIDKIRALRAGGQSDHPYYWGAFMATGDWR